MNKGKGKDHKLKLLAAYYKPYKGLFFADLFFAILGAAVTLVIPLLVRYIMTSIGSMSVAQAQKTILYWPWYAGSYSCTAGKQIFYHLLRAYDGRLYRT